MPRPRSRLRRDTGVVIGGLAIPLIMTNPPLIGLVNDYAADHPLTIGLPTFWLWLQLWYGLMLVELVVFAIWLPSWQAHRLDAEVGESPVRARRED